MRFTACRGREDKKKNALARLVGLSGARKLEKNERENVLSDTEELLEATTALILPLLHGLDALGQAGRFMHPPELAEVCAAIAQYREPLEQGVRPLLGRSGPSIWKRLHCTQIWPRRWHCAHLMASPGP